MTEGAPRNVPHAAFSRKGHENEMVPNNFLAHELAPHELHDLTVRQGDDATIREIYCKSCNQVVLSSDIFDLMANQP